MAVTGHENVASINSYVAEPSLQERANMSAILATYGKDKDNQVAQETEPLQGFDLNVEKMASNQLRLESTKEALFAGDKFIGPVTFNIQINK
jgi:hypothetical protein